MVDDRMPTLQKRIEERLTHLDKSAYAISKKATGNTDAIRRIFKGHMPDGDRLERIAEELGTTSAWLLGRDDAKSITQNFSDARTIFHSDRNGPPLPVYSSTLGADLAIEADGTGAIEVTNIDMNEVVGHVSRPPGLDAQVKAYGVYVVGSSMEPRFDPGQAVFVDISRPPRNGDDVVIQLHEDGVITVGMLKRLIRQSSSEVVLRQFNPETTFTIARSRVATIQRVFTTDELLGI